MRIVEIIKRVGQSARILPIHVNERVKRGKSTSFFHFRKRQELGGQKSGNNVSKTRPGSVLFAHLPLASLTRVLTA